MSIALAVIAADTFVQRRHADDCWCRELGVDVAVADPGSWTTALPALARTLGFLTGDMWHLAVKSGGGWTPRGGDTNYKSGDCVSLFSGGLDSTAGLFWAQQSGRTPILASHSYPRDGRIQDDIISRVQFYGRRVSANFDPVFRRGTNETSMRARSLGFIAIACMAATTTSGWAAGQTVDVLLPENGFIAINPPLTLRRLGSHSTRTTHPGFIGSLQVVLDSVGMRVRLVNPFELMTKGEILSAVKQMGLSPRVAAQTVSCGKWKRRGIQCGRCVPCLIRRAAFHAAGVHDSTDYQCLNLASVLANRAHRDDLLSMIIGCTTNASDAETWASKSGPLPDDPARRRGLVDVVRRGATEVLSYLQSQGVA